MSDTPADDVIVTVRDRGVGLDHALRYRMPRATAEGLRDALDAGDVERWSHDDFGGLIFDGVSYEDESAAAGDNDAPNLVVWRTPYVDSIDPT